MAAIFRDGTDITPVVVPDIVILQEEASFVHSDEHPFCSDLDCPCHNEEEYWTRVGRFLDDGTMTGKEGLRLYWDQ